MTSIRPHPRDVPVAEARWVIHMLHKASRVRSAAVLGTDGEIGTVHDLYFDNERWTVRYLVISTGSWLLDRRVLISPMSVAKHWNTAEIPIGLNRSQVEGSPDAAAHQPISRQYESALLSHYGYPFYWGAPGVWGAYAHPAALLAAPPQPADPAAAPAEPKPEDQHLHSVEDVTGYHIHATDGEIGHVDDLLIEEESWRICYLQIDTSNWIGGKALLISPGVLRRIDWATRQVHLAIPRDSVKESPSLESVELGPGEDSPPFVFI